MDVTIVQSSIKNVKLRLRLEEKYCVADITKDMSIEYLIPTTIGAGALTTSLVDYLFLVHNNFIEMCHDRVAAQGYDLKSILINTML